MSSSDHALQGSDLIARPDRRFGIDAVRGWLVGFAAGTLGLGPWLISGARLPLQNLWGADTLPDQMPIALLPLNQYELTTIVVLLVVGGAAAGLAVRIWGPTRRKLVTRWAAAGVLTVQIVAMIQSFTVLNDGLMIGTAATIYIVGLLIGGITSLAISLIVLLLIAAKSRTIAALGIGLISVPVASWTGECVVGVLGQMNLSAGLPTVTRWIPAVLVGGALAWCGLRSARQGVVWFTNLALLWLVPALFTSASYVFGTRVSLGNPQEMLILSQQILTATLGPDGGAAPIVLIALFLAVLGIGVRAITTQRQTRNGT